MREGSADEIALVPPAQSSACEENTGSIQIVVRQNDTVVSRRNKLITKIKRAPICYFLVLTLGILLLLLILSCIFYETYRSGQLLFESDVVEHSSDDYRYHMNIVNTINSNNLTWKARYNRFASRHTDSKSEAHDAKFTTDQKVDMLKDTRDHIDYLLETNLDLPTSFDARLRWPLCPTVHMVPNQGGCGSCWSVAATATMSDRVCIASNGTIQSQLSAQDLTSCCSYCGGCHGTMWALSAFHYWKETGIVTGGSYASSEGCRPYEASPSCGSPCAASSYTKSRTPACSNTCQPLYSRSYEQDLVKASKAYVLWADKGNSETASLQLTMPELSKAQLITIVKKELLLHGPVMGCFTLYEDFQHYEKGIYKQAVNLLGEDRIIYGHCAKLLGWGSENGQEYWIYMNTWGREWGENGFFRVNINESPEEAIAGLP